MLTKPQLIDSVIELNPFVRREWLAQFSTEDVRAYLARLQFANEPRGGGSVWTEPRSSLEHAGPPIERRAA